MEQIEPLETETRPFADQPPLKNPVTWVRPELVVEVKYAERTPDGSLRAPVFQHLRDDKPASDAQLLKPVPPPEEKADGNSDATPTPTAPHPDSTPAPGGEFGMARQALGVRLGFRFLSTVRVAGATRTRVVALRVVW